MHTVAIRRREANRERTPHDFIVRAPTTRALAAQLGDALHTAQLERGSGVWSGEDPEIWVETNLIGCLAEHGNPASLVLQAMDRVERHEQLGT